MTKQIVYDDWLHDKEIITLVDNSFYAYCIKNNLLRTMQLNNWGYLMMCYPTQSDKLRPLHVCAYHFRYKVYSEQFKFAIHHKNSQKLDNRSRNLKRLPWKQHAQLHHIVYQGDPKQLRTWSVQQSAV